MLDGDSDQVAAAIRSSGAVRVEKRAHARRSPPRISARDSLRVFGVRERLGSSSVQPDGVSVCLGGAEKAMESELLRVLHDRLPSCMLMVAISTLIRLRWTLVRARVIILERKRFRSLVMYLGSSVTILQSSLIVLLLD